MHARNRTLLQKTKHFHSIQNQNESNLSRPYLEAFPRRSRRCYPRFKREKLCVVISTHFRDRFRRTPRSRELPERTTTAPKSGPTPKRPDAVPRAPPARGPYCSPAIGQYALVFMCGGIWRRRRRIGTGRDGPHP